MRVNGERIKQAREVRGLTQEQLAARVNVSQPHVSLVEQGAEAPSESMLEAIALATGFPTAFFGRPSGPDFPLGSLLYRKSRKIAASDTAMVRQNARVALELVAYLSKRFKPIPVAIPRTSSDPDEAAQLLRSHLGVSPDGPLVGLVRKLEKIGALILYLPLEVDGFEAFSAWSNEEARRPVVFLRRSASGDRVRHTLAHELGHLVLHQDFLGAPSELEREANLFAAEVLFPGHSLRQELRLPLTLTQLAELKRRWGVSMESIAYHASNIGLITQRQYGYIIQKMQKQGWHGKEPVHIPLETPRFLPQMIETGFQSEGDAVRRISKEIGIAPAFLEGLIRANRPIQDTPMARGAVSDSSVLHFRTRHALA